MTHNSAIECVFVYGTLKRGQVRERCWPRRPLSVEAAWIRGKLFDLGPHPALTEGDDQILGELWRLNPADLPETLRVLDRIEGFRGRSDDWYTRIIAHCTNQAREIVAAYTYQYARPLPAGASRVLPDKRGFCAWFGGGDSDDQDA